MAISPSPFDRISNPRRRPQSGNAWMLWVALLAVLVLAVLFFRQQSADIFWRVAAPLVRTRAALGGAGAAELQAQASTTAALADRNALYKENLELKSLLGRTDVAASRVLAGVLQRPPWTPYDTLLIDAGAKQGVAVDDLVSAGGTALIGRVSEVYDTTSRVELLSAPGASYQAMLNATVPVAVEGQGAGSMQALVPLGTQVKVGDTVTFPGLRGGVAAQVSAVDARAGESFIVIYMHLPADPFQIGYVEIWKGN